MISVLKKVAQLNVKYRKKKGPHNRCLHRGPTRRSYGPDNIGETLIKPAC